MQIEITPGLFYRCRDGYIVGPMISADKLGFAAALGGKHDEYWLPDGGGGKEGRDLIAEVKPPLTWTGVMWIVTRAPMPGMAPREALTH